MTCVCGDCDILCCTLSSPANGVTVSGTDTATLVWGSAGDNRTYEVYIWRTADAQPSTPSFIVAGTSLTVTGLVPGTQYTWSVQAKFTCDPEGERATRLIWGPLNRIMNLNCLRIQVMLEGILDAAPLSTDRPTVVVDLNGHSFTNLIASAEADAPARKP